MFSVFSLKSKFLLYHVAYYPKKNRKTFPTIFGHPQGRGRTTPIFWQNLNLGILTKFFHHRVAHDQIKKIRIFKRSWVTPSGVAGSHPFYGKN